MLKTKKNIAIICFEFPPGPGGIGNHAFNVASQLHNENYRVSVLTDQQFKSSNKEKEFDSSLPFDVLRIALHSFSIIKYIKRIVKTNKLIRNNETVLASGKFALWIVAFYTIFYKRNFLSVIHGTEVNYTNKILRKSIDISLKRYNTIIAVSNYTKSLISYLNLKNVHVIQNGFSMIYKNNSLTNKPLGTPSLITVGTVSERKGQINIISILPHLIKKFPKIHYNIVGNYGIRKSLEDYAKKMGVLNYITFYGPVSDTQKVELLEQSDIFTMMSQQTQSGDVEGFGIAILEANSLGIPAIGATNCGIEDAINNASSGFLVANADPIAYEKALKNIINDYAHFQEGAKAWSKNFTWEIVIQKYLKLI